MPRKATSTDVAKLAAVSRSAVSLVLSGRAKEARLSDDTQERVFRAAEELHYKPNAAGRSLVRGSTETVALVIRDLALLDVDPFLASALTGILQECRNEGYRVLVEAVGRGDDRDAFGELMDSGRIDGMIVENPDYADPSLQRLIRSGRPVVIFGSQGVEEEYSVGIDDRRVGFIATEHLILRGRRRIAHIPYSEAGIYGVNARLQGYKQALRKARIRYRDELVIHANFSMDSGYDAMCQLLEKNLPLDGLFVGSDAVAIGAMAALEDAHLTVPQDVAVASVDDIRQAGFCRPPLTTVPSHPFETGKAAARILLELVRGQKPRVRNVLVSTALIVRQSS